MCKTYEAIHKVAKNMHKEGKADKLAIMLNHKKIIGKFECCEICGCLDEVITLKDAKVICMQDPSKQHEVEWINIPSFHIMAFTFNPCGCD